MKKEYELIQHSKMKHINIFTINIIYRNFHMHSDFELLLVLEGAGNIRIKNDNYEVVVGDSILLNPGEMHEIDSRNNGLKFVILQFSRHFLNDYFPLIRNTCFQTHRVRNCFKSEDYDFFLNTVLCLATSYIRGQEFFPLHCLRLLSQILIPLYQNLEYEILNENSYQEYKKRNNRMNRIASYIDENFLYPIRLQDIAARENISTTHLSHFFADNFGVTFQEYLNDKRLEQALRIAGNEDYSLTALSELSGFSDPKYLNKAFLHKFGCSFQEYKKTVNLTVNDCANNTQALQYYYSESDSLKLLDTFAKTYFGDKP